MKIATFNVNSARLRAPHLARWLERAAPDAVVLQEIKCEAHQFPAGEFESLGYSATVVGQKAYNGVALLTRHKADIIHTALPGLPEDDAQARYIEAQVNGIRLIGIYLPNGNSRGAEGFAYKLNWMDLLGARARELLEDDIPAIILGDFNVCPTDADYAPGALSPTDALVRPESRARFRTLINMGLTDAVRALHPTDKVWTFWDYQAGAWERDSGLRIDHLLLSPTLAERLETAGADRELRGETQPSDHVPAWITLSA